MEKSEVTNADWFNGKVKSGDILAEVDAFEKAHREYAGRIAHDLVMHVNWPWSERQKKLWYIGILADTGMFMMADLEKATIEHLQYTYKQIYGKK